MNNRSIKNVYDFWAPLYDSIFRLSAFHDGRKQAVALMGLRGAETVLEIGVGSGLSLELYPDTVRVVGIDLSEEMIAQCRKKIKSMNRKNVSVEIMDAENLAYADNSFDRIAIMFVASVTPDPARLLEEAHRVCKDGGDVILLNHFVGENKLLNMVKRMFSPFGKIIGFRTYFTLGDLKMAPGLYEESVKRLHSSGYHLIHMKKKGLRPGDIAGRFAVS